MGRMVFDTLDDFRARAGTELGVTRWVTVDQASVDAFAAATNDHHWLHVDPERARGTRFGGTIAHGYLTLCRHIELLGELWDLRGFPYGMNYGLDRVRFPAPMPVGARMRMHARLAEVEDVADGVRIRVDCTFEREDHERPVCVARWVAQYFGSQEPT